VTGPRPVGPPRLAVDAEGYVWRVYPDGTWSMAPVDPGNRMVPRPVTFYVPAAECGGDGCIGCVQCCWSPGDETPPEVPR
jgi:hypothetical protein